MNIIESNKGRVSLTRVLDTRTVVVTMIRIIRESRGVCPNMHKKMYNYVMHKMCTLFGAVMLVLSSVVCRL